MDYINAVLSFSEEDRQSFAPKNEYGIRDFKSWRLLQLACVGFGIDELKQPEQRLDALDWYYQLGPEKIRMLANFHINWVSNCNVAILEVLEDLNALPLEQLRDYLDPLRSPE